MLNTNYQEDYNYIVMPEEVKIECHACHGRKLAKNGKPCRTCNKQGFLITVRQTAADKYASTLKHAKKHDRVKAKKK
jgi:DnaJ-class molecular chaperone